MKYVALIAAVAIVAIPLAHKPASAQLASSPAGNAEHGKSLYRSVGCYECHGL